MIQKTTAAPTVRGTPCGMCGAPIKSPAWLRRFPYATECGRDCFLTAALSEPLYDTEDGHLIAGPHPAALRERARLAALRAA